MSLRIVESDSTFLVIDPTEDPPVIDAYATRAEAESFLQFIGQVPADDVLNLPTSADVRRLDHNHGEECACCGAPLYTDIPGLCGGCKQYYPLGHTDTQ